MKIFLIIFVLLLVAVVTGGLLAGPQLRAALGKLSSEPKGTTVRTEVVARGSLIETVSAPGQIEPDTRVQVAAVVSARVVELPVREGEELRKGDIVGRLDDRDLKALLLTARARRSGEAFRLEADRASLAGTDRNLGFARKELERKQALFDSGDLSRQDLDNALQRMQEMEASVESMTHRISVVESSLEAADAEIERAQDGLNNTIIVAPIDGVITRLNVEVGEIVTGSTTNPGTIMMTIADLSRMLLKAEVAESDIADVVVGQRAKLYINAYPDEVFSGTVRQIALQRSGNADGTGFFETEIEIDLQGRRIYSGLVANADIEIETHEGIVVPYQAIVTREVDDLPLETRRSDLIDHTKRKANVIYRVVDGKAMCTPIKPGPSDLTHRVILEGIGIGDEVVVGPFKILESITHDEPVHVETPEGEAEPEALAAEDTGDAGEPAAAETSSPADTEETEGGFMIIRTRNLHKTYRVGVERIHALRGADLDIEENEFVAIMGSSGSGKSTLMNLLGCLDRPTGGHYHIAGRDVSRMGAAELAHVRNERIGFVFQSFELLPRASAMHNVELPLVYARGGWRSRRRRARAALDRVGLADRMTHRPNQLSGGQKQRVAIARAILNEPAILLADEPTGNLDSSTTREIMALFEQLHDEGQTILIVTHEDDVAAHCRRIIRLADGHIASDLAAHEDPTYQAFIGGRTSHLDRPAPVDGDEPC